MTRTLPARSNRPPASWTPKCCWPSPPCWRSPAGRETTSINSLSSTSATRDFRLLAVLADAVVGHTAGQVYPLLQSMSGVLGEIRDEAAADSLVERIAAVRRRAKRPIDQRALDLLEMLVERRAAEIQNQPGPHVGRSLAALRRAWKRQWSPGEPRLMAGLLASLGRISQPKLAEEQIGQLQSLYQQSSPAAAGGNADDRLQIGCDLAGAYWNYSRCDQAIDLLSASLDEHQAACGGVLPAAANGALGTLIGYLEARTQHARGERILQEQLKHPANRQQSYWLIERLYELYDSAIQRGGEVSLGSGLDLYRAVQKKVQQDLDTPDQNHRFALAGQLCNIYRSAHNRFPAGYQGRGAEEVAADARRFAFERLPAVLPRLTNNYTSIVSEAANMLHNVAGPRDALAFLIRRIEGEPHWLRLNNQDGWSQHSSALAEWRAEVFGVGDLDAPLLAIVSGELRRDLHSRQQRNRTMYNRHEQYFWADKEADFARIADEVWARRQILGAACLYIAEYLHHCLDHYDRAIDILLDAHRREVLDEQGQSRLVQFLHRQRRFAESISILEPLVDRRPDNLPYRVWLMHACFETHQPRQLADLLKKTHDYFHHNNRWQEYAMATLGQSCLENELYQQAVDYLQEAIVPPPAHGPAPRHRRRHPIELLRRPGPGLRRAEEDARGGPCGRGRGCRLGPQHGQS